MLSTLAQRLHTLRMGRQLTLNQLAQALNERFDKNGKPNTEAQIGRWERGNRSPAYPELIKLAQFFEVSIDYLVGRSDTNDEDIANSFVGDKNLFFEGQSLSQSDRSEIYQLIRGYLHGKQLHQRDVQKSRAGEISLPLEEPQTSEINLPLGKDDNDRQ